MGEGKGGGGQHQLSCAKYETEQSGETERRQSRSNSSSGGCEAGMKEEEGGSRDGARKWEKRLESQRKP